tara:strand:+ start:73 stop:654 length:582 start_codon:yes stop_codon:yes gene_type:complete
MFGNVLNNNQIMHLCEKQDLIIEPFDKGKLKLAHYALTPASVLWLGEVNPKGFRQETLRHAFRNGDDYTFASNEYAVVEIQEFIKLRDGLFGHFVPASILIDQGFSITAGKIDPQYGGLKGQRQIIRFGIKNLQDKENILSARQNIAHVYFVDLRGLNNLPNQMTHQEIEFLMSRWPRYVKQQDDGPDYGTGE